MNKPNDVRTTRSEEDMKGQSIFFGKRMLPLVMLVVICAPQELYASGPVRGESTVVVKDGMMSLAIDDCPLGVLVKDIERQSRVRFTVSHSLQQDRISLRFQAVPFLDGLKRILIRKSYLMLFDRSRKLVEVLVIQKREGYKPPTTPFMPRYRSRTPLLNPRFNRAN
jgi:hypothetical protein